MLCDQSKLLKYSIERGFKNFERQLSTGNFFDTFGSDWWNINGRLSVLHDYNQKRIPFIAKSYLLSKGNSDSLKQSSNIHLEKVLKNLTILDVGCGGGILSEALAKFGSNVLGIDPSHELISVANRHKSEHFDQFHEKYGIRESKGSLEYKVGGIEDLKACELKFDIVVASEVIEHIDKEGKAGFLHYLAKFVKPEGILVVTTPGRSLKSYLLNIVIAERLIGKIPAGTHKYDMFIGCDDLKRLMRRFEFTPVCSEGVLYIPPLRRFVTIQSESVLYMAAFRRKLNHGLQRNPEPLPKG